MCERPQDLFKKPQYKHYSAFTGCVSIPGLDAGTSEVGGTGQS